MTGTRILSKEEREELLNMTEDARLHTMRAIEREVSTHDWKGLRARWRSGAHLLAVRHNMGGARLPNGMLRKYCEATGQHHSELTARMKFANKCRTEEQFTNLISKFPTWYQIKQFGLTEKPRAPKSDTPEQRIIRALEHLDPACVDRTALYQMADIITRLELLAREASDVSESVLISASPRHSPTT